MTSCGKLSNRNNRRGNWLSGFSPVVVLVEGFLGLLIASAMMVAAFHMMIGLWVLASVCLFAAGAFAYGLGMFVNWREGR